jgi:cytochrome d ubiquinol oxidase subunit II
MKLQDVWFVLVAFFWSGYLVLEGFDFGVGMLLPFVPRGERERGAMLETIGPVWDGNEVWLVVAGGVTFAAFPAWYGTMFSAFYLALLLVLFFLIIRVVSFEWRSKGEGTRWRGIWLWANSVGSFGASFVWGVALANLLHGVPLNSNGDFTGTFWDLFNGYTVVAGLTLVVLFAFHGATFLTLRTRGDLCERASRAARLLSVPTVILGAGFLVWTVKVAVDRNDKSVFPPVLPAALGIAALLLAALFIARHRSALAFAMTAAGTLLTVVTLFTSLYPRVMVSSPDFSSSLTVANASSAHYTLVLMTVVAALVTPVVLLYQGWSYRVFWHRLGDEPVADASPAVGS